MPSGCERVLRRSRALSRGLLRRGGTRARRRPGASRARAAACVFSSTRDLASTCNLARTRCLVGTRYLATTCCLAATCCLAGTCDLGGATFPVTAAVRNLSMSVLASWGLESFDSAATRPAGVATVLAVGLLVFELRVSTAMRRSLVRVAVADRWGEEGETQSLKAASVLRKSGVAWGLLCRVDRLTRPPRGGMSSTLLACRNTRHRRWFKGSPASLWYSMERNLFPRARSNKRKRDLLD